MNVATRSEFPWTSFANSTWMPCLWPFDMEIPRTSEKKYGVPDKMHAWRGQAVSPSGPELHDECERAVVGQDRFEV